MRVTGTNGKKGKYGKIMEEYLHIVPLDMFIIFQDFLFDENPRYEQLKPDILKLKELFKQRTIELEKIAQKDGHSNYIEAYLSWNQIPRDKYESFLKNIDSFVSLVMSDEVPVKILMAKEKNWNIFNTPFPLGNQIPDDKFEIPNEILNIISTYDQRLIKYKDRIDIIYDKEIFYSSAYYNKNRNIAEIRVRIQKDDIYQTLNFISILGRALNALELADKGEDPHKIPKYLSEYIANKYVFKFIKSRISLEHQKVLRYNLLSTIALTLFEIDIFTNPEQNFDKAYAKAINQCFLMTHQTGNPFYVYYKKFILRPMVGLILSIVEMELYLENPL